jgi:4-hydroxy-3-methylbut-2-enyl diphosphate reductase
MEIVIDPRSGFCFGVKRAIEMAEKEVAKGETLYCLGEIVHNTEEVNRLRTLGIRFIDRRTFSTLSHCKVMIRAHGEPPETYQFAESRNIELIDATCPVVLKLQDRIRGIQLVHPGAQIVIYGKKDHPEIIGLRGQAEKAIIIESFDDIDKVDFSKPVFLYAQTTKDKRIYSAIKRKILERLLKSGLSADDLKVYNSICGQVANRAPWLRSFSKTVETLIFVGGKSSSNSKILFEECKKYNSKAFFITKAEEVDDLKMTPSEKIGITGATSTPSWLIEAVASRIRKRFTTELSES